jgi:protein phosphatase
MAVASIEEYVLHLLRQFSHLKASEEQSVLREFQAALTQADQRLVAEGTAHPEYAGMGATATLAFVSGWRMFLAHAGDTRCYLFRGGSLQLLTEDHTVAAEMARRGMIAPEDVAANPFRHVVTNVLGGGKPGVRADVSRQDLEPNDVALLCSDGLTDMVPDERIAGILAAEEDAQAACERLVEAANAAGGKDNVTAVVARFAAG